MSAFIKILGCADGVARPDVDGRYVKNFSPHGYGGRGMLVTTARLEEACRFPSRAEAWLIWREQSNTHPLRDDGKPNRPLTAFHCEIADFPS